MDQIVEDLDGVEVIMDDVIIARDNATHDERLMKLLTESIKIRPTTNQREMHDPPEGSAL